MTSLRWASQELTKVPTAAQLAAPKENATSSLGVRTTSLRWASQELAKVPAVAQLAAPRDDKREV